MFKNFRNMCIKTIINDEEVGCTRKDKTDNGSAKISLGQFAFLSSMEAVFPDNGVAPERPRRRRTRNHKVKQLCLMAH